MGEMMNQHSDLTIAQKAALLDLAAHMERVKNDIPGGAAFQMDLLLATAIKAGLTVVDAKAYDDMLAALKDAETALKYSRPLSDSPEALQRHADTEASVRAAIAKAEGRG